MYYHQDGYLPVNLGPVEGRRPLPVKPPVPEPFRIAINAGWTKRTAPLADGMQEDWKAYYEGLLSGTHLGADLTIFFGRKLGATLMYDIAHWQNNADALPFYDVNGSIADLPTSDRITVGTIGPAVTWRWVGSKNKGRLLLHLGGSYTWYRDEEAIADLLVVWRAKDLCLRVETGYELLVTDYIALGVGVGFVRGTVSQFQVDVGTHTSSVALPLGTEEALHRVNLSGGIRSVF